MGNFPLKSRKKQNKYCALTQFRRSGIFPTLMTGGLRLAKRGQPAGS